MKAWLTHVTPQHPNSVKLQWDLTEVTESGTFLFAVQRAGSPGGPWTTIATALVGVYTYTDNLATESAQALSLVRDIYYRVIATPPSLLDAVSPATNLDGLTANVITMTQPVIGTTVTSPGQQELLPNTELFDRPFASTLTRKRLLKRAILRHQQIGLQHLYGVEFWLLKRLHFGVRCPSCYDPNTNEVLNSQCATCYGTSWTSGYFTPVAMLGKKINAPVQSGISSQTKDDVHVTQIQMLDFPRIDEGDILVEKFTNKRFLVRQRNDGTLKNIIVFQILTVSELPRNAVEYTITVTL